MSRANAGASFDRARARARANFLFSISYFRRLETVGREGFAGAILSKSPSFSVEIPTVLCRNPHRSLSKSP